MNSHAYHAVLLQPIHIPARIGPIQCCCTGVGIPKPTLLHWRASHDDRPSCSNVAAAAAGSSRISVGRVSAAALGPSERIEAERENGAVASAVVPALALKLADFSSAGVAVAAGFRLGIAALAPPSLGGAAATPQGKASQHPFAPLPSLRLTALCTAAPCTAPHEQIPTGRRGGNDI